MTRIALGTTALFALLIGYFTLTPVIPVPGPPASDKLHHFIAFLVLCLPSALLAWPWAARVAVFALIYAGLIEIIQPYVGREGEWLDFWADVLGILVAYGLGLVRHRSGSRPPE